MKFKEIIRWNKCTLLEFAVIGQDEEQEILTFIARADVKNVKIEYLKKCDQIEGRLLINFPILNEFSVSSKKH
jgi:hypothetical protein